MWLQQLPELFRTDASVSEYGSEGPTVEFGVIGHDHLGEGLVTAHDNMASGLAPPAEAGPLKGADALPPRDPR